MQLATNFPPILCFPHFKCPALCLFTHLHVSWLFRDAKVLRSVCGICLMHLLITVHEVCVMIWKEDTQLEWPRAQANLTQVQGPPVISIARMAWKILSLFIYKIQWDRIHPFSHKVTQEHRHIYTLTAPSQPVRLDEESRNRKTYMRGTHRKMKCAACMLVLHKVTCWWHSYLLAQYWGLWKLLLK